MPNRSSRHPALILGTTLPAHTAGRPVNDNLAVPVGRWGRLVAAMRRIEQRTMMPLALGCLLCGLLFGIAAAFSDSVVISHASRSAMVFGFVGLRRAVGFGPDTPVDASP